MKVTSVRHGTRVPAAEVSAAKNGVCGLPRYRTYSRLPACTPDCVFGSRDGPSTVGKPRRHSRHSTLNRPRHTVLRTPASFAGAQTLQHGICVLVFGIDRQGLPIVRDGTIVLARSVMGIAPVIVGGGIFGIELDSLAVVGDGTNVVLLVGVGIAPVVVGGSNCAIELDRLVEVGDGAVVIPLGAVGYAAVMIGPCLPWIARNNLSAGLDLEVEILALSAVVPRSTTSWWGRRNRDLLLL